MQLIAKHFYTILGHSILSGDTASTTSRLGIYTSIHCMWGTFAVLINYLTYIKMSRTAFCSTLSLFVYLLNLFMVLLVFQELIIIKVIWDGIIYIDIEAKK